MSSFSRVCLVCILCWWVSFCAAEHKPPLSPPQIPGPISPPKIPSITIPKLPEISPPKIQPPIKVQPPPVKEQPPRIQLFPQEKTKTGPLPPSRKDKPQQI